MSSESCSSSPRLDYNRFLKGVTWINLDYPDANNAMLEGIRNGMTGYQVDRIIVSRSQQSDADIVYPTPHPPSFENELTEADGTPPPEPKITKDHSDLKELEDMLEPGRNRSLSYPGSRSADKQPFKKKSVPTLPRSIGEERKEWILEAHRAYRLNDLHDPRFTKSASTTLNKYSTQTYQCSSSCSRHVNETTSVSCPDLDTHIEPEIIRQQCLQQETPSSSEIHDDDREIGIAPPDENESCELLFARRDAVRNKPSEIRLSPRMERFDKLIPRTSKEFLNTMRIVSEISPQPSEEQLHSLPCSSNHSSSDVVQDTRTVNNDVNLYHHHHHHNSDDSDETERIHIESDHHHHLQQQPCLSSDADTSGNRLASMVCRSYKEVCIYGPNSSSGGGTNSSSLASDQMPEKALNDNSRTNNSQSACGFPRLQKLSAASLCGEDGQRTAPPLYSSILQRSPTTCHYGCGDINCGDGHHHQHAILHHQASSKGKSKTSPLAAAVLAALPPSPLGTFDCGFCRTNNEPENVYRSHPLRLNDVVVCPSLRKYVCCFCGATGDKAHTIKYCPQNPIGFFAKKTRNSPVMPQPQPITEKIIANNNNNNNSKGISTCSDKIVNAHQQVEMIPAVAVVTKGKDKNNGNTIKEPVAQTEQEVKSDSESSTVVHDESCVEPVKRTSGNWIEAKTKGRKRKNGK